MPTPADHARPDPRNEDAFQLCQPTMPESRVRGVAGGRVFTDVQVSQFITLDLLYEERPLPPDVQLRPVLPLSTVAHLLQSNRDALSLEVVAHPLSYPTYSRIASRYGSSAQLCRQ